MNKVTEVGLGLVFSGASTEFEEFVTVAAQPQRARLKESSRRRAIFVKTVSGVEYSLSDRVWLVQTPRLRCHSQIAESF